MSTKYSRYRSDDFTIAIDIPSKDQLDPWSDPETIRRFGKKMHKIPNAANPGWQLVTYLMPDGEPTFECCKVGTEPPETFVRGGTLFVKSTAPLAPGRACKNYATGDAITTQKAPDWLQQKFKAIERTFPKTNTASERLNRLTAERKKPTITR